MDKQRKTILHGGLVIAVLHLLAVACMHLNAEDIFRTSLSQFLILIRTTIYIALFTAWGFSVRHRIIAVHTRKYLTMESVYMVIWMLLRLEKYAFAVDPHITRLLWYMYYIPMLLIPLTAVLASLSLGRYGTFRHPRWTYALMLVTLILIILVMTNDFHQQVFVFPENAVVFSDRQYQYGPGYYLILVCEGISILLAFGIMLYRCHLPRNRRGMYLPVLPIAGMLIYTVLYVTQNRLLQQFAPDLTIAVCCLTIAAYESCIGNGLIQTNTHYRELFENTSLPMCIMNAGGSLYMASKNGRGLAGEVQGGDKKASEEVSYSQTASEKIVTRHGQTKRIRSFAITGGTVFWEEDITDIQNDIATMQDLQETLQESHMISLEEYRTNKEKMRLEEMNRIYDRMQFQTEGCLTKLEVLLRKLAEETDKEKEQVLMGKMAVYGAYFKRRNNLLFAAETQKRIRGAELSYCLKETSAALSYLGIRSGYEVDESGEFSLDMMIRIYDLVQKVIESALDEMSAFSVIVRRMPADVYDLLLSLSVRSGEPAFPEEFEAEQEEPGEYLLTCRLGNAAQHGGQTV